MPKELFLFPFPSGKGLGCVPQGITDQMNHPRQVITDRMIRHSQHANPEAGQVGVAQVIVALLVAMRTAVNFHHQTRLMAVEVDDVRSERLLSPEMDAQAVAAQLLPHDALFRSHVLAQFGGPPQQFRISWLTEGQSQHRVVLARGQWRMERRALTPGPFPTGKGNQKKHLSRVLSP
jgi:hypothetical protein